MTTRGFTEAEFDRTAELVVDVLTDTSPQGTSKAKYSLVDATGDWVRAAVGELLDANPLYPGQPQASPLNELAATSRSRVRQVHGGGVRWDSSVCPPLRDNSRLPRSRS